MGGLCGVTTRYGQRSYSAGKYTTTGTNGISSQQIDLVARITTFDNAFNVMYLDGDAATQRITVASGTALFVTVNIGAVTDTLLEGAHYIRKVAIKNQGGTTSLIGAVSTIGTDVEDDPAWDVQITADNVNDALKIEVKGNNETIRWTAHIEGVEIAPPTAG